MNAMDQQSLAVALTPLPTAARVARHRRVLKWRWITTIGSLAALVLVLVLMGGTWSVAAKGGVAALWLISTVVTIGSSLWSLNRAKADLASIVRGEGLRIGPEGIEVLFPQPVSASWSDISGVRLSGQVLGAGPRLILEKAGQEAASVPLSFLDTSAGAIENAMAAYSLGRIRLDTSARERML